MAERVLMNEYKALSQESWTNIELVNENIFEWDVALIVLNPDSIYYGGYFKAKMTFPKNYPFSPPDFKFMRSLYHPNVYPDGRLCISILHPPGDDEMSGELASERWSPAQRVESVLLSILSLLDDAEPSSPANVDAGVLLRKDPAQYKEMVKKDLEISKQDIPADYVMPTHEDAFKTKKNDDIYMEWEDSDADSDFGASDSDMGDFDAEDDEDDEDMDDDDSASDEDKDNKKA
ncbi:ubiquitin conjugating enzyme [Neofusicoccum parvum]|uniref:Ubiquitin-conjugating enzyme E2 2 n=2 Tax=Neofusicoccum parvum TaxID=310453 RepID=R1GNY2_BOTPV|nr:putative ubiquitin conjugating enzyme protein [Neofusicoccum parvum UCRNP2]GME38169.1 ubiquitin conjugating enzyme [Neofusicoccum parvum]GME53637.1 ubiquitin conjugating enzyme [Neofusicoccum parvum]